MIEKNSEEVFCIKFWQILLLQIHIFFALKNFTGFKSRTAISWAINYVKAPIRIPAGGGVKCRLEWASIYMPDIYLRNT